MIRLILITMLLLSACSAEPELSDTSSPAQPEQAVVEVSSTDSTDSFDTSIPVRMIMNTVVQPNVLQLWQAVRYVATADGVEEDVSPRSDEDWQRLRTSAITLIETSNALQLPGRLMDIPVPDEETPDYMYRSEEIQTLVEADPELWNSYIQQMQFFTKATLETIEKRDVLGLIETGAAINNACEGCHAEFWYRR